MPIADFARYIAALLPESEDLHALADTLANAAALHAYADARGIDLSEAEASTLVAAAQSRARVEQMTEADLDHVNGGSGNLPEGLQRIMSMLQQSIAPKNMP